MPNSFTYGQVKNLLASVYEGGMSSDDTRLLPTVNAAVDWLIRSAVRVNPRGVFVGGVDALTILAGDGEGQGSFILLPATHDTVLQVEILKDLDIKNGWYNILDLSGVANSDMQQDVIFIDRGEVTVGGQRRYLIPDADDGDTVSVTALKRFVPIVADADVIPVRSLEAIKAAIKVIQYRGQGNNPQEAIVYEKIVLDELKADLDRYLLDPTQGMARKAAYLQDEKSYGREVLGYVRARLALDVVGGQVVGKTVITRSINRAVERLLQHRNEIRTTGRLSVKNGIANVVFAPATQASDALQISDYEQIRCMIRSFDEKNADAGAWEAKAYKLLEDQELNKLETLRHTDYSTALATDPPYSRQWYAHKWALDAPDGLRYSDVELKRLVQRSADWIYNEKYRYLLIARAGIKTGVPTPYNSSAISDGVPFTDVIPYEEMKLVADSLAYQGDPVNKTLNPQASSLQDSAKALLKERLEADLEALRHTTYAAALQVYIASNGLTSLGYVFNKLQLEMPDGIRISDVEMRRLVNEAVREAIQRRNELGAQEEYTNLIGPDQLPFAYTATDNGTLPYSDYEIIRLLVLSMLPGGGVTKDEATARIEANLRKQAIAYRNSEAHCIIISNPYPKFGGAWGQLVLEYQDGLMMNSNKAKRIVAEAWKQAVSHYNFLARQENYQATELALPVPIADNSVIPFSIEIIKDLSEGQLLSDTKNKGLADQYKQQALAAVERDLVQKLESSRRNLWEANLSMPEWSFGWIKAKVGLGLAELGFSMPDTKLGRLINDAERELAKTTNFVNDEADIVVNVVDGYVVLPSDCTRIIYADICGFPLETKSRSFSYLGYPASYANRNSVYGWWGYVGPWGWHGRAQLVDAGFDTDGNRRYRFNGCWQNGVEIEDENLPATTLNIVCKRKHVPRVNNTDLMLVRDVLALRAAVESELARLNKDLNSAGALWNLALQSLDQALSDKAGSDTYTPKIVMAGSRAVSRRGMGRGFVDGWRGGW